MLRSAGPLPSILGSVAARYCVSHLQRQQLPDILRPVARPIQTRIDGPDPRLARLEAVLFLAKEPLPSRRLAQLANLADGTEARTLVRQLNGSYDTQQRAFRIEEVAGGYHLLSRPQFAPWLCRLAGATAAIRLSGPALETLAVVAYRQPVLRAEIEAVRGVQCGEVLRQLMERGMVRIAGRADELGRPFLYATTKNFLQVFGLRNLDELPRASMLRRLDDELDIATSTDPHQSDTIAIAIDEQSDLEKEPKVIIETTAQPAKRTKDTNEKDFVAVESNEIDEEDELEDDYDDDDDDEFDDYEDEEDDEPYEDDFEDEEWEEVKDDDLDEDEDEDEDEDWDDDEDEDWDDEDDWDEEE